MRYKGQVKNLKKWGRGTQHFATGEILEGHFVNDQPIGRFNLTTNEGLKIDTINENGIWEIYKKVRKINGIVIHRTGNQIYIGNIKQGERHGPGKVMNKFESYIGQFREFRHGSGVQRHYKGEIYAGEFFQANRQGFGRYKFTDGTAFISQWILNQPWGFGNWITLSGGNRGYYINGKKEGWWHVKDGTYKLYYINDKNTKAIINDPSIDLLYVGEMNILSSDEYGTYCRSNRDIKTGQFKNGLLDGFGVSITNDMKKMIEGQFRKGIPQGKVTQTDYIDNTVYQGELVNGLMQGFGIQKGFNYTYEGEFLQNQYHGYGTYNHIEFQYKGQWQRDRWWGYGKFIDLTKGPSDGDSYEGYFVDGLKHGKGKERRLQGCTYFGDWKHDQRDGYGVWEDLLSQEKRIGYFKDDQLCGLGRLINLDYKIYAYFQKLQFSQNNSQKQYFNASIVKGQLIKYLGQTNLLKLNGEGTQTCNYQIDIGSFVKGNRQGFCSVLKLSQKCFCSLSQICECNDFILTKGQFINNQLVSGLIHRNNLKYVGSSKHLEFYGFGTLITSDGKLYIGEFKAGKLDGYGILYKQKENTVYHGFFQLGQQMGNFKQIIFDKIVLKQNEKINIYKKFGYKAQLVGTLLNNILEETTLLTDTELFQQHMYLFVNCYQDDL